jgi:hypothetical protein
VLGGGFRRGNDGKSVEAMIESTFVLMFFKMEGRK